MKICTKCGCEYQDDAVFCANCGAPVHELNNKTAEEITKIEEQTNEQATPAESTESIEGSSPTENAESAESSNQAKAAPAKSKTSTAFILGIAAIIAAFVPALNFISPALSVIGIVFGVKEVKQTGEKTGLVLSIISAIPTVISFVSSVLATALGLLPVIVGFISSLVSIFGTFITYLFYGTSILAALPALIEALSELF